MLFIYNQQTMQEAAKQGVPVELPMPKSPEEVRAATSLMNAFNSIGAPSSLSQTTPYSYDDFIDRSLKITDDLINTGKVQSEWKVVVNPYTGSPSVFWNNRTFTYDKDGNVTLSTLCTTSVPEESISLVPSATIDFINPDFRKAVEAFKKSLSEKEKFHQQWKPRKGQKVTVREWEQMVGGYFIHSAPIEELTFVKIPLTGDEENAHIYQGQMAYYTGRTAVIKTVHRNGLISLTWDETNLENNRMLIDNHTVIIAEQLVWTKDALEPVESEEEK